MDKAELVVELGVEEIPSSMLEDAACQFRDLVVQSLKDQRLGSGTTTVWYTPRRIIAAVNGIPVCQEDLLETVTGPPKSVAYDSAGKPTKAALAFAHKNKVPIGKIQIVQTPKGEYLSIVRKVRGEKTPKILARLIPSAIMGIQFPKTMYWSADHFRFARPLRWIVALFNDKVVRFSLAGITSSNNTAGHRFLGKPKIEVSSLVSLKEQLRNNAVWVDPEERLAYIKSGLLKQAEACGGRLLEDTDLLKTVVNLNEAPSVVCGSFENRFLMLPKEILITVMREHQKYFSVLDKTGQLLPVFLAVVNLQSDQTSLIRTGHERVLRARLADASFFWETDRKTSLGNREETLKNVLFQEKLGSYFDKTRRVLALLPKIAQRAGRSDLIGELETAGHLFKCDLVTEMVKEFTDLQGIVGGLYAQAEGYPENVWRAVYEQYLPKSTSGASPQTVAGALLGLADRLDTLCGCFSVGLIPSGSKDPFAVRRQGNGLLKIILDHRLNVSLNELMRWGFGEFGSISDETANNLREFLAGRLRFLLEEMQYSYDCINAVMAVGSDDPLDATERLRALQEMRNEPDFLSLASNFKRVVNILSKAENAVGSPDESLFKEAAEIDLWQCYCRIRPAVESVRQNHDYRSALRSLASMRSSVDEFFNKILVMADDTATRNNRISLLDSISRLFKSIADISKIIIDRSGGEDRPV